MATARPSLEVRPKRRRWLRRVGVLLGVLALAGGGTFYLRPLMVLRAVGRVALWQAGFESRYTQLGSHRIHYFAGGRGEPLVLVHGLGGSARDWTMLAIRLAKGRRVYALDLLGYGDSDKPGSEYSIAAEAEIVRLFLDSQGLRQTDVAGWSMGGWVSLELAARQPQRVRRLVVFASPGLGFQPEYDPQILNPRSLEQVHELMQVMAIRPQPPRFIERDFLRHLQGQSASIQNSLDSMLTGKDALDGRLGTVRMPVLLVWGKDDRLTPLLLAQGMQREMPHAELVEFEGCGHAVPVECQDRVLPRVQSFLGGR